MKLKTDVGIDSMSSMSSNESLDKFGEFIIRNLRDGAIDFFDKLLEGYWKATKLQKIQAELKDFTLEQKNLIRKCFVAGIDTAIHDFLYALEENQAEGDDIQLFVDGTNVLELSESLHSEIISKGKWFSRFSRYKIEF